MAKFAALSPKALERPSPRRLSATRPASYRRPASPIIAFRWRAKCWLLPRHLETEFPSAVGGFRGMGEGGTIGGAAAIANALADALAPFGAKIFELPMTPERLFCPTGRLAGDR